MSENVGLSIKIGADASGVTETFSKVANSVKQTTESFEKVKRAGADATYALSNMSRILQDAPYGFMGIANNINPALESFQRLQKETGSAGAALKAMVGGLTGPAGLGLAVGAISSLLVVFGDKLFSSSTASATLTAELSKLGEEADTAAGRIEDLMSNLQFGNRFGSLFGKSNGLGDVALLRNELDRTVEATKRLQQERQDFQNGPLQRAQMSLVGLDGDALKQAQDNLDKLNEKLESFNKKEVDLLTEQATIKVRIRLQEQADAKEAQKDLEAANKKREAENKRQLAEYEKYVRDMEKLSRDLYNAFLFAPLQGRMKAGPTDVPTIPQPRDNRGQFLDGLRRQYEAGLGQSIPVNLSYANTKELKDQIRHLKLLEEQQRQMAAVLTQTLTPAFESMFDAIANGGNAFEAFGKALVRAIEQLIAQLAAMATIAAIISAIFPGAGGFTAVFGQLSGIKIPKHAAGGITTGAQIGMIGEAGPEAIIPLNRLPELMGQIGGRNDGGFIAETRISGSDIIVAVKRAGKSLNRRF